MQPPLPVHIPHPRYIDARTAATAAHRICCNNSPPFMSVGGEVAIPRSLSEKIERMEIGYIAPTKFINLTCWARHRLHSQAAGYPMLCCYFLAPWLMGHQVHRGGAKYLNHPIPKVLGHHRVKPRLHRHLLQS